MGRPRDVDFFDDTIKVVLSCPEITNESIAKIADELYGLCANNGWDSMEISDYYEHDIIGKILRGKE